MTGTQLEPSSSDPVVVGKVDTAEVPSAAWGWSGEAPRFFRFLGWFFSLFLLAMLIGNHHGRVEDLYLIGLAGLMIVALVIDIVRRRRPR
ncbi:DUF2631 domain-containing protein [Rhodococcus rhodnii]|uniref:DUF2631 domain-containing protein n=2 Tax=Rhodococcus rhodnii TaxID=38312 RepID=R7WL43_9NOCA|nr:DUF2631 domain-containing protein [Rhodococcus rhodnii]EOM76005.1 hypothetical protein Rrhod_2653 [Rhodococcus rhodnii LMG 5362]TXG90846.1 DUF2631 domain-containing protein [Rhodococcus rhodnii]